MPQRRDWSRAELVMAMNLYCRIPFGKLHKGNPLIVDLATALGRTSSSIAMKLVNFASLDPVQQARGVRGLSGASRADKEVWDLFHADWDRMADESERLLEANLPAPVADRLDRSDEGRRTKRQSPQQYEGLVEGEAVVKVRYAQRFFRRAVLAAYDVRCCITGNPIPELLAASHIIPWAADRENRADPRNGLCLARTQDAAFDKGLFTLDEQFRVVISRRVKGLLPDESVELELLRYEGVKIKLPDRFTPEKVFLEYHRQNVFSDSGLYT